MSLTKKSKVSMNFLFQCYGDGDGDGGGVNVSELQAVLSEREAEIQQLKEELTASKARQEVSVTQVSLRAKLQLRDLL